MRIEFGWTLDGAAWADAGAGAAGTAQLGPRGLVTLLQNRLGLTRPAVERSVRTAEYSRAIAEVTPGWTAESFVADPWATAEALLSWRDEAIEAGAQLVKQPGLPARLDALTEIEDHLSGDGPRLLPGPADDLLEITLLLTDLLEDGDPWPLGISQILCHEDPEALPGLWTTLLGLLEKAGVDVEGPSKDPFESPDLEILEAEDEWTAAEAAARFLAGRPAEAGALQILATSDTIVLDQELRRRELPAIGIASSSPDRTALQILPLLLSIAQAPVDVQQLAAFLDLRVLDAPEDEAEPIGLVPTGARRALLDALAREPGVGGGAWRAALDRLAAEAGAAHREERPQAEAALSVARALDALVTNPIPPDALTPERLRGATAWLGERLRTLGRGAPALLRASAHLSATLAVLETLPPQDPLTSRTLGQILTAAAGSAASPLSRPEATGRWSTSTSPSQLRPMGGDVLWWGAEQSPGTGGTPWDRAEIEAIAQLGGRVLDPTALVALETDAGLRGLRGAGRVIAVRTRTRAEEPTTPSSLLAHLALGWNTTEVDVARALAACTTSAAEACRDAEWEFAGSRRALRIPPQDSPPPPPEDLTRSTVAAPHLVPTRLSYSQAENLLGCRQKWTYESGLGIRPASISTVPTGNRMIGTLVHAVVERLVEEGQEQRRIGAPTVNEIGAAFDHLVPQLASELLLPGREVELTSIRQAAVRSLEEFFRRLGAAGLTITAVESAFEEEVTLALRTGEVSVPFIGYRDIMAEDAEGRPTVIDLKWTAAATKYPDLFDTGEALQLAAYAWSLPGDTADTGYFLLKQGEFVSANPMLDPHGRPTLDVSETWETLRRGVTEALDAIGEGRVDARSGQILLDDGKDLGTPRTSAKKSYDAAREAARSAGGIVIDARCDYCDVSLLCGLRGDRS